MTRTAKSSSLFLRAVLLLLCCALYCFADIAPEAIDSKIIPGIDSKVSAGSIRGLASTVTSVNIVSSAEGEAKLKEIQYKINNNTLPFCYLGHSGTKEALKRNNYGVYAGDIKAIVYPFCLMTRELGNRLGNYFTELGCAQVAGVHFIAVHKQFDVTGARQGINSSNSTVSDAPGRMLVDFLPDVWLHPSPVDPDKAAQSVRDNCKCTRYCWGNSDAPWINSTALIGDHMLTAVTAYSKHIDPKTVTTVYSDTDFTNAPTDEVLPLIPDVTIQYRCGDNIQFNYMYGILPFTAFPSRIPMGSKYIYVLSDHPSRAAHSQFTSKCQVILKSLFEYLKESNPTSIIVVKRGGDLFLDYVRMTFAKVLICSASTYCFWPALANVRRGGDVYFPITSLIAGADNINIAPKVFGSAFHWIVDAEIISDLRKLKPWTLITDILSGKMKMPV